MPNVADKAAIARVLANATDTDDVVGISNVDAGHIAPTATLLLPLVLPAECSNSPNSGVVATVGAVLQRSEPDSRIPEAELSTAELFPSARTPTAVWPPPCLLLKSAPEANRGVAAAVLIPHEPTTAHSCVIVARRVVR